VNACHPGSSVKETYVHRRFLSLLTASLFALFGFGAALPNPAHASDILVGIDRPAMVAICDHYGGIFLEEDRLSPPYTYGCLFSDGQAECDEKDLACLYRPGDELRPPFEESCDRIRGHYSHVSDRVFDCDDPDPIDWDTIRFDCEDQAQGCVMNNVQPMPEPPPPPRRP
jgi:hypothetical protein